MARCGCGASGGGVIVNGPNTVVTGSGTAASPYQITAHTDCDEARACLSQGDGITYTAGTGVIAARLSGTAGNAIIIGGDGGLYASPNNNTVNSGPGVLGNGSVGSPVRANVSAWPYAGAIGTYGQGVFVDGAGLLKSPPMQVVDFVTTSADRTYADLAVNTTASPVTADTFVTPLANPDPNRSCAVIIVREVKVRFTLPASSSASISIDGVDSGRQWNMGGSSIAGAGVTMTRMFKSNDLPPGGTSSYNLVVGTLNGTGSSTYSRIETSVRVLYIAQA